MDLRLYLELYSKFLLSKRTKALRVWATFPSFCYFTFENFMKLDIQKPRQLKDLFGSFFCEFPAKFTEKLTQNYYKRLNLAMDWFFCDLFYRFCRKLGHKRPEKRFFKIKPYCSAGYYVKENESNTSMRPFLVQK